MIIFIDPDDSHNKYSDLNIFKNPENSISYYYHNT
jgi:hypothetical protein